MPDFSKRRPPNGMMQKLYAIGLGSMVGRLVLLLTTTGRKTGLRRVTPLQYEVIDGDFYVAAARGQSADWFRNIVANPCVEVAVKSRRFQGRAVPITEPQRIADFLKYRLERHPRMAGMILRSEGLPDRPNRAQLEAYAQRLAMVIIHPEQER
jgi:deazaflavin-dependent oxidoreductase (nitroreductase family)